jgi:hypothetical protein
MTSAAREHAQDLLARVSRRVAVPDPDPTSFPVVPPLRAVIPELRRGQVVEVHDTGALALALIAGASGAGSWCAVVGLPEIGVLAAAAMGCDPEHLLLVDHPGQRWVDVVAALVEAVDVVLVRLPARPPSGVARRLTALARRFGTCLLVIGGWDGAAARIRVDSSLWTGVHDGHGHLQGRRVKVVADARGGRPRSCWVWLPAPDGSVQTADLVPVEVA